MESQQAELEYEILKFVRVYKDGCIERLMLTERVPPSFDPITNVTSKDIVILPDSNVSARFYLPELTNPHQKLPLLVYFHGGAFCIGSPATPLYHNHLNLLASKANVVAVSVDYRLAPEHPLPIAYEDSWAALRWVASHVDEQGSETWLKEYVDFNRVFLAGDSAGGNIAHNMAVLAGDPNLDLGMRILGIALIHPHFWGSKSIGSESVDPNRKEELDKLWPILCPSMPSNADPRVNPFVDGTHSLTSLGCRRVLVFVAERDMFRDRGWLYYETLIKSGWKGVVEIGEEEGVDHVFHLFDPTCEKAKRFIEHLAVFLN